MRAARLEFGDTPAAPSMAAALAVLEHRTALLQGNLGAADQVAEWLRGRVGEAGEALLLQAWTDAAAGRQEAARSVVAPLHDAGLPTLLAHTLVEVHLIGTEAALQAGDRQTGRAALEEALAQAEPL